MRNHLRENPMTQREFELYRTTVQRKGKAMALPKKVRCGKYGAQYFELIDKLNREFRPYVAYYITDGKNNLPKDMELAEYIKAQNGIYAAMQAAIYDGDLKKLDRYCEKLKEIYFEGKK